MLNKNQLCMNIDENGLFFLQEPEKIIFTKKNDIENDDDYPCLFCGGKRTSSRRCCSPECSKHLNDYTNSSIPDILVKTLLSVSIEERVKRIRILAKREKVSFQSLIKHFIFSSKKIGATQSDIIFTQKIAEYIEISGNIPVFLISKENN